ncbi:glycosyltransferase family 4 protein [Selenomonas ruminantium]|uniref:glycosyltransferase family 4 protein n=1 Tax=Selenomonas ruminantium TaxID=971 RepID=UPI0026EB25A8|nr:glycosyltransferase family 4 protein [Selenomonas ruminantium]
MRIVIFGIGRCYQRLRFWLERLEIVAFIDNDPAKQGNGIYAHKVYAPARITNLDFSFVFVLGKYKDQMRRELMSLGVSCSQILTEDDLERVLKAEFGIVEPEILWPVGYDGDADNSNILQIDRRNILLFSHDLSLTGAPVALLNVAKVLQRLGYAVVVATGAVTAHDLHCEYALLGIPVVYDFRVQKLSFKELQWISGFDLLWVNTATLWNLFSKCCHLQAPVIWWLHEPAMIYDSLQELSIELLEETDWGNINVYGVSEIAIRAFAERCSFPGKISKLLLGVEDFYKLKLDTYGEHVFVFALIGSICENKGQDLFLQAIKEMPTDIRKKCQFWLIGDIGESSYSDKIMKQAADMEEVVFYGRKSRNDLKKMLGRIDVVVVSSLEETLSLAVVEGMMNKTAVICSDESAVGVARFVREAKAGLLVPPGNVKALMQAMIWVVKHAEECTEMGKRGRCVYERYFSLDALEMRVSKIVEDTIDSCKALE